MSESNDTSIALDGFSVISRFAEAVARRSIDASDMSKASKRAVSLIEKSALPAEARYCALTCLLEVMRACLSEKERYAILIAQEQEEQKKATRRGRWTRLGVASLACAVSFIPNVAPEVADSIRFYLVLVAYVVLEDPLFTRFVDLISFGRK